jgi:hypothetical protein
MEAGMPRVMRRNSTDLTPEQEQSLLFYLTWVGDEPIDTAFGSDAECLACWKRHREHLMSRWDALVAIGHRSPNEIPWGRGLELGMTPARWMEHNRAARTNKFSRHIAQFEEPRALGRLTGDCDANAVPQEQRQDALPSKIHNSKESLWTSI